MRELISIVRTSLASLCVGVTIAMPAQAGLVKAIEYAGDHMFQTANPNEIAALDSGAIAGWVRTGLELWVHDAPDEPGLVPVCRFYSATFAPRSSHFYTADAAECTAVKANPDWVYEGIAFYARLPDAKPSHYGSGCPRDSSRPVFRWYNNGRNGAPGHRFTPFDQSDQIVHYEQGRWTADDLNYGWNGIAFCMHWSAQHDVDWSRREEGRKALLMDSTWEFTFEYVDPTGVDRSTRATVTFTANLHQVDSAWDPWWQCCKAELHSPPAGVSGSSYYIWGSAFYGDPVYGDPSGYIYVAGPIGDATDTTLLGLDFHFVGRDRVEGSGYFKTRFITPVVGRRL